MHLFMNMMALKDRQRFDVTVIQLDAVGERRGNARDITVNIVEQRLVIDHDAAVVVVEFFSNHAHGHIGLSVKKCGSLSRVGQRFDLIPLRKKSTDVGRYFL